MTLEAHREELLAFLETISHPGSSSAAMEQTGDLVEAGLIDSLSILQIVLFLEQEYDIDFAQTGVEPERLRSVDSILNLILKNQ